MKNSERFEKVKLVMEECGYKYIAWNDPFKLKYATQFEALKGSYFVTEKANYFTVKLNVHSKNEVLTEWKWIIQLANTLNVQLPHPYHFVNCVEELYNKAKLKRQGRQVD